MEIALAALGFIDNDIDYNKKVIINALEKYAISYENFLMSRWLENKKPIDFTQ